MRNSALNLASGMRPDNFILQDKDSSSGNGGSPVSPQTLAALAWDPFKIGAHDIDRRTNGSLSWVFSAPLS